MSYWAEISARLAGLGSASAAQIRAGLQEFDVRDIEAVRIAEGGGGGGSQPEIVRVRIPIAFDTPDFVANAGSATGIVVYTPEVRDILIGWAVSVATAWNPTMPATDAGVKFGWPDTFDSIATDMTLTNPEVPGNSGRTTALSGKSGPFFGLSDDAFIFQAITPLRAWYDDNSDTVGGNPGATQGEGELIVVVLKASA